MRCKIPHILPAILPILLMVTSVLAQQNNDPFDPGGYSFIRYDTNRLELVGKNPRYEDLFAKFDSLIKSGNNQINIVHIGGSHIQADMYTHRMRQDFQSFYPGVPGPRGFFFPYSLAHTNSPSNLWIAYSGTWLTCKNTQEHPVYTLGLSGFTAALASASGSLKIVARYDSSRHYDFNRIRVFCNVAAGGAVPEISPPEAVKDIVVDTAGGFVSYTLDHYTDTLFMNIHQGDSASQPFQLYGISLENDDPGVVYNSIGVNGARLKSYLRCELFVKHLRALKPDLVIVSIGTNEGNTRDFDGPAYRFEYAQFLDSVRQAAPDAAILLTVPNDSYLFKRYINPNTALIRDIIFDVAETYGCGVWDFYTIMGGLNSSRSWYNHGLMNKDHIHFNRTGYRLKGDLLFNAFVKSWGDHLPYLHPISGIHYPAVVMSDGLCMDLAGPVSTAPLLIK